MPDVYVSDEVANLERLYGDLLTPEYRRLPIWEQLEHQAQGLLAGHHRGDPAVVPQLTCWHPTLRGSSLERLLQYPLTLSDARETLAREYGFPTWGAMEQIGAQPPHAAFEEAVDLLLTGDASSLRDCLKHRPDLAIMRSCYGHRATLLHYVGSNGVETYRQRVPLNLAELCRLLLEAGADVHAEAAIYGSSRTLELLETSIHPWRAGVLAEVREVLVAAGARGDASPPHQVG